MCVEETMAQSSCDFKSFHAAPRHFALWTGPHGQTGKVRIVPLAWSLMEMITKIEAAERQLDTVIKLFFENIDHLSSYTLAAASREITDDLCDKKSPNF
jgi:hypothetical protein